jgi:hypothetical protein
MNVAGVLARAMKHDGTLEFEAVTRLLNDAASARPLPAGGAGDEGDEASFFIAAERFSADELASQLLNPRFAFLAQPLDLSDFIPRGEAGLPRFTENEVDQFLAEVTERDPGYPTSWLEFAPSDDEESWVAYPQNASMDIEFHLLLPIAQEGDVTRLLALDPGLEIMTDGTRPPRVVSGTGCDPGVDRRGVTLLEVCLPAGCAGECTGAWSIRRERLRLTGCDC